MHAALLNQIRYYPPVHETSVWDYLSLGNFGYLVFGLFVLFSLLGTFFTVQQQNAAVVQRLGKFARVAQAGLNFKLPWIESVAGEESLRVQQLDLDVETKTLDNVFVKVKVAVQYFVLPAKVADAFYKLDDPENQIEAYVFDVVRARVPKIGLDAVFEKKDDIADAVKDELSETMQAFGYGIVKALVTDVEPDGSVKAAMNAINAAQRNRMAASEQGEADKTLAVKKAEAEAESKALQGKGIADQRRHLVDGLRESVGQFRESVPGATAQDVMSLVLMTQYFDTLKEIGASSRSNAILIPHSPGTLGDITSQIRNAMIVADRTGDLT